MRTCRGLRSKQRFSADQKLAHSAKLLHLLEVHDFFIALISRCRQTPGHRVVRWWSEKRCTLEWSAYGTPTVRPDGDDAVWERSPHGDDLHLCLRRPYPTRLLFPPRSGVISALEAGPPLGVVQEFNIYGHLFDEEDSLVERLDRRAPGAARRRDVRNLLGMEEAEVIELMSKTTVKTL